MSVYHDYVDLKEREREREGSEIYFKYSKKVAAFLF